jgi:hypothetical protein
MLDGLRATRTAPTALGVEPLDDGQLGRAMACRKVPRPAA